MAWIKKGAETLRQRLTDIDDEGLGSSAHISHLFPWQRDDAETRPASIASDADHHAHRLVRAATSIAGHHHHHHSHFPRPAARRAPQSNDGTLSPDPDSQMPTGMNTPASVSSIGSALGGGILAQLLSLRQADRFSSSETLLPQSDSAVDLHSLPPGSADGSMLQVPGPGAGASPEPEAHEPEVDLQTEKPVVMSSDGAVPRKREKVKWYRNPASSSTANLVQASLNMGRIGAPRPEMTSPYLRSPVGMLKPHDRHKKQKQELVQAATNNISIIIGRQRYIIELCRALMAYGAPTHRLEEYMSMSAKVLSLEAQFLYMPGCMIMSFSDPLTCTAEVKLVRMAQGVDLGRLAETHNIYKNVVHQLVSVDDAAKDLREVMSRKPRYHPWLVVFLYGVGSAAVGPYAFMARPIDLPIIFVLGCLVGFLQLIVAPRSVTYANVFEVTAAILTSFISRALGSISYTRHGHHERVFCFSTLAQSSIALILPGFAVLCSSLELQSHQLIAGSIRLVHTIIFALFLGYGVTVGTTIYGLIDKGATQETTCPADWYYDWGGPKHGKYVANFVFVAIYAFLAGIINQSRFRQSPAQVIIAVAGYVTNFFTTEKLGSSAGLASTVGAFTMGLMGNLYSRLWRGHAVTAVMPGIFTLVPSGLASTGSIISGLDYSQALRNNTAKGLSADATDTSLLGMGYGMIQTAIGISIGLFISALVVYPVGKRHTGLFSF